MNIGIICEFNPFHAGHKYLIDSVKKENCGIISCMSGNFVQRGEFAVYDKFKRAKAALENGADLVIELPCEQATLSAEGFAKSACSLLESTGITDKIAFGAETDDAERLIETANMLQRDDIREKILFEMKSGVSYPAARREATGSEILDYPNNILGVEYIKATSLPVEVIKRIGKGHDTDDINYSASAIRKTLDENEISSLYNCEKAVLYKLRNMNRDDFARIADVTEGLENRIYEAAREAQSLDMLYDLIKSKRYTLSRIKRIVLRSFLSIEGSSTDAPYIRILGFNEKGREMLGEMKKKAQKPIVSRIGDCESSVLSCFERECKYTDIYNLGYKKPLPCGTEQRSQIVII